MAFEWSDALLAGLDGAARFSEQERQKRQARLDRATELQDRFAVEQAKSKYAMQVRQYEDRERLYQSLGDINPESAQGQLIMMKHFNPNVSEGMAVKLTAQNLKQKTLLKAPKRLKAPELNIPAFGEGPRAVSPLSEWVFNFEGNRGKERYAATLEEFQKHGSAPVPPAPDSPSQPSGAVPPVPPSRKTEEEGEIEDLDTPVSLEETDMSPRETIASMGPQGFASPLGTTTIASSEQDQEFLQSFAEPVKFEIRTQEGVKGSTKGLYVNYIDPRNPNRIQTRFVGNGEAAVQQLPNITKENADGSKDLITQQLNLASGEVEQGEVFRVKSEDPLEPVELVKGKELRDFMQPETDTRPAGEFWAVFPKDEQDKWKSLDQDSWIFPSEPEGLREKLGSSYLEKKTNLFASGELLAADVNDPELMAEIYHGLKGLTYLEALGGPEGFVDAVNKGAIDPALAFGPEQDDDPTFIQIQQRLQPYIDKNLGGELPRPLSF